MTIHSALILNSYDKADLQTEKIWMEGVMGLNSKARGFDENAREEISLTAYEKKHYSYKLEDLAEKHDKLRVRPKNILRNLAQGMGFTAVASGVIFMMGGPIALVPYLACSVMIVAGKSAIDKIRDDGCLEDTKRYSKALQSADNRLNKLWEDTLKEEKEKWALSAQAGGPSSQHKVGLAARVKPAMHQEVRQGPALQQAIRRASPVRGHYSPLLKRPASRGPSPS